jgi:alpha-beta hydrolase superfamily lysophospholipase
MKKTLATFAAIGLATTAIASEPRDITAKGPEGDLAGTLIPASGSGPVVLIVPGSGPTDRDGNNPLGVTAASYRLLAEALAEQGIGSLRIDKRGMFASKAAVPDPNNVTIAAYAHDVGEWVKAARKETGAQCVFVLGHSEGGLVALEAAQTGEDLCGLILVASVGRPAAETLREQITSNPANAPIMEETLSTIASLEAGERVAAEDLHPALLGLFPPSVQGYWIDIMARDPAALAGRVDLPVLILAGGRDIQTPLADAEALAGGQPDAKLVTIADMNHVLKKVEAEGRAANLATYADPSLPVHPDLVAAIADFVSAD